MYVLKDFAMAMAILYNAHRELEVEFNARSKILLDAQSHIQSLWNRFNSASDEFLSEFQVNTPPDTTKRTRKALERQEQARHKHGLPAISPGAAIYIKKHTKGAK